MRLLLVVGVSFLLLRAVCLAEPAAARWSASVHAGTAILEEPGPTSWRDGHFAAQLRACRPVGRSFEAGAELGYLSLGRLAVACVPEIPCPRGEGDAVAASAIGRWRPAVGRLRPYVLGGGGAYAIRYLGRVEPDGRVRREVRPGLTAGCGLHGFMPFGIGVEARWHAILDGTRRRDDRNTDVLTLLLGINFH